MKFIKKIIKHFRELHKYFFVGIVGVAVIYIVNFFGVELFKIKPEITYAFATIINYLISFWGNAKIFKKKANGENLKRFMVNSVFFLILTNIVFVYLIRVLNLNYLVAITVNFVIFPLSKFLIYKYLVFKVSYE